MHIKINSEEDLLTTLQQALHILNNMRHAQKDWHQYHGAQLAEKRKRWETRADQFLANLEAEKPIERNEQIQITIQNNL